MAMRLAASIAAGNLVNNASLDGLGMGTSRGPVPSAQIAVCGSPSPSAPASPAAEFGSPPPSNLVGRARMFELTGLSILALESSHFRYFPSQSSGPHRLEILVPQVVTRQI
ncbi:hypothetical protein C1H46_025057 [Malus baccata]|uniref:Uncharacterized protein n=1 Tax=Malus baccata TaxID=106549 RepID=A0A540LSD3_MALBA|nr:hypothetical protein C1H46_025057 [Malus baccata]